MAGLADLMEGVKAAESDFGWEAELAEDQMSYLWLQLSKPELATKRENLRTVFTRLYEITGDYITALVESGSDTHEVYKMIEACVQRFVETDQKFETYFWSHHVEKQMHDLVQELVQALDEAEKISSLAVSSTAQNKKGRVLSRRLGYLEEAVLGWKGHISKLMETEMCNKYQQLRERKVAQLTKWSKARLCESPAVSVEQMSNPAAVPVVTGEGVGVTSPTDEPAAAEGGWNVIPTGQAAGQAAIDGITPGDEAETSLYAAEGGEKITPTVQAAIAAAMGVVLDASTTAPGDDAEKVPGGTVPGVNVAEESTAEEGVPSEVDDFTTAPGDKATGDVAVEAEASVVTATEEDPLNAEGYHPPEATGEAPTRASEDVVTDLLIAGEVVTAGGEEPLTAEKEVPSDGVAAPADQAAGAVELPLEVAREAAEEMVGAARASEDVATEPINAEGCQPLEVATGEAAPGEAPSEVSATTAAMEDRPEGAAMTNVDTSPPKMEGKHTTTPGRRAMASQLGGPTEPRGNQGGRLPAESGVSSEPPVHNGGRRQTLVCRPVKVKLCGGRLPAESGVSSEPPVHNGGRRQTLVCRPVEVKLCECANCKSPDLLKKCECEICKPPDLFAPVRWVMRKLRREKRGRVLRQVASVLTARIQAERMLRPGGAGIIRKKKVKIKNKPSSPSAEGATSSFLATAEKRPQEGAAKKAVPLAAGGASNVTLANGLTRALPPSE